MTAERPYSCSQRIGFVGILTGFSLCLAGAVSPFWIEGEEPNTEGKVQLGAGFFWFCLDGPNNNRTEWKTTGILKDFKDLSRLEVIQILAIANIVISLISGIIALSRCSCCPKGKPVCHGLLTFVAGAVGISVIVFTQRDSKLLVNTALIDASYGWSFYLYCAGSTVLILASFLLCLNSVGNRLEETTPLKMDTAFTSKPPPVPGTPHKTETLFIPEPPPAPKTSSKTETPFIPEPPPVP